MFEPWGHGACQPDLSARESYGAGYLGGDHRACAGQLGEQA